MQDIYITYFLKYSYSTPLRIPDILRNIFLLQLDYPFKTTLGSVQSDPPVSVSQLCITFLKDCWKCKCISKICLVKRPLYCTRIHWPIKIAKQKEGVWNLWKAIVFMKNFFGPFQGFLFCKVSQLCVIFVKSVESVSVRILKHF